MRSLTSGPIRRALGLLATGLVLACGSESDSPPMPRASVEAEFGEVVNDCPTGEAGTLPDTVIVVDAATTCKPVVGPVTVVLASDPSVPLDPNSPLVPRPDGGFVTGTYQPGKIAYWSAEGSLARTYGRVGEGPGEFGNRPRPLAVSDDGLVWVASAGRITVFRQDSVLTQFSGFGTQARSTFLLGSELFVVGHGTPEYDEQL